MSKETPFTHAGLWLNTLLNQFPQYNKGELYIERFCEACKSLQNQNLIQSFTVWDKNSPMDQMGVDITLDLGDKIVDFQVTSSWNNAHKHMDTNKRHPERGVVRIVYVREGNRQVMKSVKNLEAEILRKAELKFDKK